MGFFKRLYMSSRYHGILQNPNPAFQDTSFFFQETYKMFKNLKKFSRHIVVFQETYTSWKGILENRLEKRPFFQDGSPRYLSRRLADFQDGSPRHLASWGTVLKGVLKTKRLEKIFERLEEFCSCDANETMNETFHPYIHIYPYPPARCKTYTFEWYIYQSHMSDTHKDASTTISTPMNQP